MMTIMMVTNGMIKKMAAGWNRGKRKPSAEAKQRLSLLRKGIPRTEQDKQKIKLGQQNSIKNQRRLERLRQVRELLKQAKQQAKDERRREIETRRMQRIAMRIHFDSLMVGPSFTHTRDGLEKISEANKGRTPWNKGLLAWNHNKKWPDEVKQNISRGMVVYWIQKKEDNSSNSRSSSAFLTQTY